MATKQSPPKRVILIDWQFPVSGRLLRAEEHCPRNDMMIRRFTWNSVQKSAI